jgi:hypothetical protein
MSILRGGTPDELASALLDLQLQEFSIAPDGSAAFVFELVMLDWFYMGLI